MQHAPKAYTYDADTHCPSCAEKRFGRDDNGFIGEHAIDSEGNPIGIVAPWDDWFDHSDEGPHVLACGTCSEEIERCCDPNDPD